MTSSRPQPDLARLPRDSAPQFDHAERLLETVWRERPEDDGLSTVRALAAEPLSESRRTNEVLADLNRSQWS